MATSRSSKKTVLNQTSSYIPHLDDVASETTLIQVKKAIEKININVGDIVLGDISVQSDDTTTHEKLDTLNTSLLNKHLNSSTDSINISGQSVLVNTISGFALDSTLQNTNTQLSSLNSTISNKYLDKTNDSVNISGQSVLVNTISGFALDSTLQNTNTQLSSLNTSLLNKHLDKTTDSISISGQSILISNLPSVQAVSGTFWPSNQPVSGTIEVSNLPTIQPVSGDVNANISGQSVMVSNFPISFEISSLPSITIENTSFNVGNFPTTQAISGDVNISGQSLLISNFPSVQTITGTTQSTITNSSLDTHLKSFHSGSWVDVVSASNGHLLTNSSMQDGDGNDLTSKLISSSRALDVNIINTTDPIIIDFANPILNVTGSVDINNFPTTQVITGDVNITNSTIPVTGTFYQETQPISGNVNANISGQSVLTRVYDFQNNGISSTNHTPFKYGLDTTSALATTDMTNRYLLTSTSDGGSKRSLDVNVASGSITIDSVNIKDSSGNTLTSTLNNLDVNLKAFNRTASTTSNLTTVQPVGASSTVKALETYSYMVGLDNALNIPLQLTSTNGPSSNSLDVYLQNASTTNNLISFPTLEKGTGLNMYVIPSKTKTFLFNAYSNNTGTNASISSIGNNQSFSANNWGLANPRNSWNVYRTGTTPLNFYYTYVNGSGDEINVTTPINLSSASTYYSLANNIVTINSWRTDASLASGDTLYVTSSNNITHSFYGGNLLIHNNSLWTCPNNCIAWVQNLAFTSSGAEGLRLFKWNVNGVRSVMYGWLGASNFSTTASGEYGFGGYITAGETIGWGGENASITRNVSANIVCRYL